MARLPIPRRRRPVTPAERAFGVAQSVLKLWATSKAAKAGGKAVATAAPKRKPLLGLGLLAGGALLFKKLRGGSEPVPTYSPPPAATPAPAATGPVPDTGRRTTPHGDKADELPGGDEVAEENAPAPGGDVPPVQAPGSAGDVTESGAPASTL